MKLGKNMNKKRFFSIFGLLALVALVFFVTPGSTKNVSYYSGDAIYYQNTLFISTTNSNSLEIFKLSGDKLEKIANVKPLETRFNTYKDLSDSKFIIENNQLYVYTVGEYSLYKYKVNSNGVSLERKIQNNSWEWYNRVDKFGSDLVTIGPKGVKVWNNNLDTINAYDVVNINNPYNITSSSSSLFIFNITGDKLEVIDRATRQIVTTVTLNYKTSNSNRKVYFNPITEKIFVVDDYYTKKYNLSGQLEASFKHLDYPGYDVTSITNDFIYFTNGLGIVKLRQSDLSLVASRETVNLGGAGGWAMGAKAVLTGNNEKVVIFNGSNILVLDSNLNKISSVVAGQNNEPEIIEDLFLSLDKNKVNVGSELWIYGGGFSSNENLEITLDDYTFEAKANNLGRFEKTILIPEIDAQRTDIKVEGLETSRHYSISIEVL
ncbi:hypothetical protein EOL94_02200 [bacterium]|nr:hypothetical protein [bacterium]